MLNIPGKYPEDVQWLQEGVESNGKYTNYTAYC